MHFEPLFGRRVKGALILFANGHWRIAMLVILIGFGLGSLATWLVLHEPTLDAQEQTAITYPLKEFPFTDSRPARFVVERSASYPLSLTAQGTVTQTSCKVGTLLKSGQIVAQIGGQNVIALATDTPFFRELKRGDKGRDVLSLKFALASLDLMTDRSAESDVFDVDTLHALNQLAASAEKQIAQEKDASHRATSGPNITTFSPENYVWIPQPEMAFTECGTVLGHTHQGGVFANASAGQDTVTVQLPDVTIEGKRQLMLDEAVLSITESGPLREELTQVVLESPSYRALLVGKGENDGTTSEETRNTRDLQGNYQLVQPLVVYQVPPAAIVPNTENSGCVYSDQGNHQVDIVSSSLGLAYIRFRNVEHVPSEVLLSPEWGATCD